MTSAPPPMDIGRFRAIVLAFGADPARWPEAERQAAESLLAISPEARAASDNAAALDGTLRLAVLVSGTDDLARGIVDSADRRQAGFILKLAWSWPAAWRPATALVAAALLGIVAGATIGPFAETVDDEWVAAEAHALLIGPEDSGFANGDG